MSRRRSPSRRSFRRQAGHHSDDHQKVAAFTSERWPPSRRNGGRLRVGMGGRIRSESPLLMPLDHSKQSQAGSSAASLRRPSTASPGEPHRPSQSLSSFPGKAKAAPAFATKQKNKRRRPRRLFSRKGEAECTFSTEKASWSAPFWLPLVESPKSAEAPENPIWKDQPHPFLLASCSISLVQ